MRTPHVNVIVGPSAPIRVDASKERDPEFSDPPRVRGFTECLKPETQPLLWEGDDG